MNTDPMFTDRDTDDELDYTRVVDVVIVPPATLAANPLAVVGLVAAFLACLTAGLWAASAVARAVALA